MDSRISHDKYDRTRCETVLRPQEENHLFDVLVIGSIWTVFLVLI